MITGLSACDAVNQLEEKESQLLRENTQREEAALAPLAGRYEGVLLKDNGLRREVRLVLVPNMIIVQNPGRNDITQFPTLGGTLSVVYDREDGGEGSVIPVAHYTMAKYHEETGALKLNGSFTSGSSGNVMVYLEGVFLDGRITGRASSSLMGEIGTLDVSKVDQQ